MPGKEIQNLRGSKQPDFEQATDSLLVLSGQGYVCYSWTL
jgi:hypothetical protein